MQKEGKTKVMYLDSAQKYFSFVLAVDPSNVGANYGMGTAFYNQGVDIVNNTDYDIDLITLDKVGDNAKELFLKAKPYMEKAHQLEPDRTEIILGLCGIYYALYEEEKSIQLNCKW